MDEFNVLNNFILWMIPVVIVVVMKVLEKVWFGEKSNNE